MRSCALNSAGTIARGNWVSVVAFVPLLFLISLTPVIAYAQSGEEGMKTEKWLVSQHEFRNLVLVPDAALPEWNSANMLTIEQGGGININLMSVHNNTYVVILVQRELNTSLGRAGIALSFNSSSAVWANIAGQQSLIGDHHVKSMAALNNGILTVVFGRPLASDGSGIEFKDEAPYSDFVKVVTWDNGFALNSISFDGAPAFGLELLPYINLYPTSPLLYSSAILIAGFGFIMLEVRKHRK